MGKVRTIPQVNQAGQKSGQESLEITYGGLEAPFGGIDSSAPPAYIDGKCFTDCDGFLVIDNKLVVASFAQLVTPTLWNSAEDVILLKFGTFFSSIYGQLNYALGYTVTASSGPPESVEYTFYITAWSSRSGAIIDNSTLNLNLFSAQITAVPATFTLPVLMGEPSNYTDSGTLQLNYGASNVFVGSVNFGYTSGMTVAQMVTGIVAAINAASGSTLFTAAPSEDGLSVVLTASTPGVAGNNLQIADASFSATAGNTPAFYFPTAPNPAWTNLQQGKNAFNINPPQQFSNVSTTEVGGTLYIANLGPFILKYAGPQTFAVSTVYAGVQVIKKFAGSLIGLGTIAQLGTVLQNADMIFSWSAAEDLDEWSPVDSSGNVTGAGFSQLDDIADFLAGLIVTNNTAFILRSQGISYATAIQNGTDPFQFAHIGLGEEGEGAQNTELVAQYDQTGAYVGNSDIFQISGSIGSIGAKIKAALFSTLTAAIGFLSSAICAVFIGGDEIPIVFFMIGNLIYAYNTANQTWTKFSYITIANEVFEAINTLYGETSTEFNQSQLVLGFQGKIGSPTPVLQVPEFYALTEGVPNTSDVNISANPFVTFPQEELLFGRDVTIDALYISMWADVDANVLIKFYFNGVLFNTLTLVAADWTTLDGNPTELKIFPNNAAAPGTGVFTSHSPQLQIEVFPFLASATGKIRFAKIQEYASFDPNQRPV